MRLPSTLDPRRRRASARSTDLDDEYEYEYVEVDADAIDDADLGDGWEWAWVEADETEPDTETEAASAAAGTGAGDGRRASGRGRRVGRFVAALLPLAADADADADAGADAEGAAEAEPVPAGSVTRRERLAPVDRHLDRPLDDDADDGWEAGDVDDDGQPLVDPRIAARRDGIAQARRTRLRRRLVAVAVVVAVIVGVAALTRSPALDVDEIVVTGTEQADPADLVAASGISAGTPLVGLDLDQALQRIQDEPWILDATIDRTWSGTVSIAVVERQPVATVDAGDGGWLLVDHDGRVVAASPEQPALPVVDGVGVAAVGEELGPEARAAIDVAAALTPGLRTRVTAVDGSDPDAIELTLQPSGTVRFGPADALDERIRSLQAVFAQVDLLCLQTIDLRVPDAPVLTRVPACA